MHLETMWRVIHKKIKTVIKANCKMWKSRKDEKSMQQCLSPFLLKTCSKVWYCYKSTSACEMKLSPALIILTHVSALLKLLSICLLFLPENVIDEICASCERRMALAPGLLPCRSRSEVLKIHRGKKGTWLNVQRHLIKAVLLRSRFSRSHRGQLHTHLMVQHVKLRTFSDGLNRPLAPLPCLWSSSSSGLWGQELLWCMISMILPSSSL